MWDTATDIATERGPFACLLVATVSRAKTDEPTEMPLGEETREGPSNHVFYDVHIDATWRIR